LVRNANGETRRLANGAAVVVQSVDAAGRLVLTDGSTLFSRQVVHGYAMTSHAAQGLTVDQVFVAGAISREGLYVSATRGREAIRVFVSDREAFLDDAGLKSEARMSALEFERQRAIGMDLRSVLTRGWRHLLHVHACSTAPARRQSLIEAPATEVAPKGAAVVPAKAAPLPQVADPISHPVLRPPRRAQGVRISL
jgi:hypothetical protein